MNSLFKNFYRPFITSTPLLKTRNHFLRSFIGGWWIICMIVNLAALSRITSMVTTTSYRGDINTIQELMDSNKRIYSFGMFSEGIKKKYEGTQFEEFVESFAPLILEGDSTFEQIMSFINNLPENDCFVFPRDLGKLIVQMRILRRDGRPLFHSMQEDILPYLESYQFAVGSPLLPAFNKVLIRLQEGGIVQLWTKNEVFVLTLKGIIYPSEDYDDSQHVPESIKLDVLKPFIVLLFAGYAAAAGIFLWELLVYRMINKRQY